METNLSHVMQQQVNHTHVGHSHESRKSITLQSVIEKVSAVALGVFAFMKNSHFFIPSFIIGTAIGIYNYSTHNHSCDEHQHTSSCARGLLESLTGVKLPPVVSTVLGLAVTVCHIDHHGTVFVPIVGVTLGNWFGQTLCQGANLLKQKITVHDQRTTALAAG